MASVSFILGDYRYTSYGHTTGDIYGHYVYAEVVDTSKTSYHAIPKYVEYNGVTYTVDSLTDCFAGCASLIDAPDIPDVVVYLGRAFSGCTALVEPPSIPQSVTNMSETFKGCTSLAEPPVLPQRVVALYECFRDCTSLAKAPTIPSSVRDMRACFYGCTSLVKGPTIPQSVTQVSNCFADCTALVEVPNLPASADTITGCFYNCQSLTKAPPIPSGVVHMNSAFVGCTSLVSPPTIPNTVTDMRTSFKGCTSLKVAPVLPNSVTNMMYCFWDCTSLTTCSALPNSVTNLYYCFYGCESLTNGPAAIPEGVEDITRTFYNCRSLKNAPSIPSTITVMTNCFSGCKSLSGNLVASIVPGANDYNFLSDIKGPLYVIPTSAALEDGWREWLANSTYATRGKVYILADGNPEPVVSINVKRVGTSGSTTEDPDGLFACITVQATVYRMRIPDGYTNGLKALTLTKDGVEIEVTWIDIDTDDDQYKITYTKHTWASVTTARLLFAVIGTDTYDKRSLESSAVLSKTTMLLDALAGNRGVGLAIGKRATREGLDVSLKTYLDRPVDINGETWFPTFFKDSWSESSDESSLPVTPCLVLSVSDGGLFYCDGD